MDLQSFLLVALVSQMYWFQCDARTEMTRQSGRRDVQSQRRRLSLSQTGRRRSTASCRLRLAGNIEACLSSYERLLISSNVLNKKPHQLERTVARRLCREYDETMQCLHETLSHCPPDERHRYLIAYRLGHLKSFMEQTCLIATSLSPPMSTSQRSQTDLVTSLSANLPETTPPYTSNNSFRTEYNERHISDASRLNSSSERQVNSESSGDRGRPLADLLSSSSTVSPPSAGLSCDKTIRPHDVISSPRTLSLHTPNSAVQPLELSNRALLFGFIVVSFIHRH